MKEASGKALNIEPAQYKSDSTGGVHPVINQKYTYLSHPLYIPLKNPSYTKSPERVSYVVAEEPTVSKSGAPVMRESAVDNIKYLNQDLGFPSLNAICIMQDNQNRLWIGTDNGLALYDGETVRTYTTNQGLSQNYINCLFQDKKGNVWIGTYGGGVNLFDGKTFRYFSKAQGLSNNSVYAILEDNKGNIWMGTEGGGVNVYDGKGFTHYSIEQGLGDSLVRTIAQDKKGNILLGTKNKGLYVFDGKGFTVYTKDQGLSNNRIKSLCVARNGNIWIGTFGGGVNVFDGKGFDVYNKAQGLSDSVVNSIQEDRLGNFWIGTGKGGANKFDGNAFRYFSITQGISNNTVKKILEDRFGNIWIGTLGGLNVIDNRDFRNYSTAQGISYNLIFDVTQDKNGNIWLGTGGGGIDMYDGKGFTAYKNSQGLSNNNSRTMYTTRNGDIWIGTDGGGINVFDGKGFKQYRIAQGLNNDFIYALLEDRKGRMWIGTYDGGINVWDHGKVLKYTTAQGLSNNEVQAFLEDKKGNIWIGTNSGGVTVFDGQSFKQYTTTQGLSHNSVVSLAEDHFGNVWIGTSGGGVNIFDGKGFKKYAAAQGLPDNAVFQLAVDRKGWMWAGTGKGLVCFKPKPNGNWSINEYHKPHGLKFEDFNGPCNPMIFSQAGWSRGKMYTAIDEELCEFTPNYLSDTIPSSVYITAVHLQERPVHWATVSQLFSGTHKYDTLKLLGSNSSFTPDKLPKDTGRLAQENIRYKGTEELAPYHLPKDLSIPHSRNHLTLTFNGLHFGDWVDIRYRYILEGLDDKWSPVTSESKADYRNVPPGKYTFKVRARGKNGIWSKEATFSFEVRPPWWDTWWARSLYIILGLLCIRGFVRWRTNTLRQRQIELADQVEKKTAEVVKQKDLLEEKQREILDSIHYASRIQRALLTSDNYIKNNLNAEYFILYKPKDIVSGDFYWAMALDQLALNEKRNTHMGDKLFFVCTADCTGHGVPGAFMSMLNISYLTDNIIERKLTEPHEILNRQREEIIRALNPDGSTIESQDGMDCILYVLDREKMKLYYAAANNPLWILREGKILIHKPDKMPVGKFGDVLRSFTRNEVDLLPGDVIYTFTDGYADQFGGPRGKKFMYRQLEELLKSIGYLNMHEQKRVLEKTFDKWKEGFDQIDDVLVIGVKI